MVAKKKDIGRGVNKLDVKEIIRFLRYEVLSFQLPKDKDDFDKEKGEILDFLEEMEASDEPQHFTREELWKIRSRTHYLKNLLGTNGTWKRAYERLEDAVDIVDAFIARTKTER